MLNLLPSEKRTLDHWATVHLFFSSAQVRCFWRCFCFRSGLVALFLKTSERGDSWCTDLGEHCEALPSVWIGFAWQYSQACVHPLLVHIFLPNFFLPVNFAFNMLWYSTHWTAPPFSNDPLWLTLFVEGVNDRLLDHCQVSSVPHHCVFKEQDTRNLYSMDCH